MLADAEKSTLSGTYPEVGFADAVNETDGRQYIPPLDKKVDRLPWPPHIIILLPVQTAVCPFLPCGQLASVDVAVQLSVAGTYPPPELSRFVLPRPPHIIISVPVQTPEWCCRLVGQFVPVDMESQLFVEGLYFPPVLTWLLPLIPPQTTISEPVHTAT